MIFRYDEKLVRLIAPKSKTAVWREVERGPRIKYDLERTVLFIKTNSTEGSGDELALEIISLQKSFASAGFSIFFTTPPKYRIFFCVGGRHFPTAIPPATDKVWMITLRKTSDIRLVIHCNDVEVLNLLINDSTCTDSRWDFSIFGACPCGELVSHRITHTWTKPQISTLSNFLQVKVMYSFTNV